MILILCEKIYCKFIHKFNRDTSKVYILIGKFNSILVQNFIPKIKNPFFSLYIQYIKNHSKLTNSSIVTNFISRRNSKLSRKRASIQRTTNVQNFFLPFSVPILASRCVHAFIFHQRHAERDSRNEGTLAFSGSEKITTWSGGSDWRDADKRDNKMCVT